MEVDASNVEQVGTGLFPGDTFLLVATIFIHFCYSLRLGPQSSLSTYSIYGAFGSHLAKVDGGQPASQQRGLLSVASALSMATCTPGRDNMMYGMAKLLNMVTFTATISLTSMYWFLWVFCYLLQVLFPAWWYELEWIPVHLTGSCLEVMASHSGWAADDSTPWYFTSLTLKRCGNANALNLWIGMNMSDRFGMYQYYAVIILNRSSHIIYHENIVYYCSYSYYACMLYMYHLWILLYAINIY